MADLILINSYINSLGLTGNEAVEKRKELEKLSDAELNMLISGKKQAKETNTHGFDNLKASSAYNGEQFFNYSQYDFNFMGWTPQNSQAEMKKYSPLERENLRTFVAEFLLDSTQKGLDDITKYNEYGFISLKNGVNNIRTLFGFETSKELEARLQAENKQARELLNLAGREGAFEYRIEKNLNIKYNPAKIEKLQQKAQEFTIYTACQQKYNSLAEDINKLKNIYHKENAFKQAKEKGHLTPEIKESSDEEFIKLIDKFFNGNEDARNEYIKKISAGITNKDELNQKFLSCVDQLAKDCKETLDKQLGGKTYEQHKKEFNELCKDAIGTEIPELYTENYITNSKNIALMGDIGITFAAAIALPGSAVVKTLSQKLIQKFGEKVALNMISIGKTVTLGSIPASITAIDAATSSEGFTDEKIQEMIDKFKFGLAFGGYGAFVSGPIGNAVQKLLLTRPNIFSNVVKQAFSNNALSTFAKTGGLAAETSADVLLDMAIQNGDILTSLETNSGMNIAMMLIGGRLAKGANAKQSLNLTIQKNQDGSFNIKDNNGKLVFKANDENILMGFILNKAIENYGNPQRQIAGDIDRISPNPGVRAAEKLQEQVGLRVDQTRLGQSFPQAPIRYNAPSKNYLDVLKHLDPEVMTQHYDAIANKIDDCIRQHADELAPIYRNFEMNKQYSAQRILDILAKEFNLGELKPDILVTELPKGDDNSGYWDWTQAKIIISSDVTNAKDLAKIISHEFRHVLQYRDLVTRYGDAGIKKLCENSANPSQEYHKTISNPYTQKLLAYAKANPFAKDSFDKYMSEIYAKEMFDYKDSDHPDYLKQLMEQESYYEGNNRTQNSWEQHVENKNNTNDDSGLAAMRRRLKERLLNKENVTPEAETPTNPTPQNPNYTIDEFGQINRNMPAAGRPRLNPMTPEDFAKHYNMDVSQMELYIKKYNFVLNDKGEIDPHDAKNRYALLKYSKDQQKLAETPTTEARNPVVEEPTVKPEETTDADTPKNKRAKISSQNTEPNIVGVTEFIKISGLSQATIYRELSANNIERVDGEIDLNSAKTIEFLKTKGKITTSEALELILNKTLSQENYTVAKGILDDAPESLSGYTKHLINQKLNTENLTPEELNFVSETYENLLKQRIENKDLPEDFSDIQLKHNTNKVDVSALIPSDKPKAKNTPPAPPKPEPPKNDPNSIEALNEYITNSNIFNNITTELGFPEGGKVTKENINEAILLKDIYKKHETDLDFDAIEKSLKNIGQIAQKKLKLFAEMYVSESPKGKEDLLKALESQDGIESITTEFNDYQKWRSELSVNSTISPADYKLLKKTFGLRGAQVFKIDTSIYDVFGCKNFNEFNTLINEKGISIKSLYSYLKIDDVRQLKEYFKTYNIKTLALKTSEYSTADHVIDGKEVPYKRIKATLNNDTNLSIEKHFENICQLYRQVNGKINLDARETRITQETVIHELTEQIKEAGYRKRYKNHGDYPNILKFLGIDIHNTPKSKITEILNNLRHHPNDKLGDLMAILSCKELDSMLSSPHAKMRFVERFILDSEKSHIVKRKGIAGYIQDIKHGIEKKLNEGYNIDTFNNGALQAPKFEIEVNGTKLIITLDENKKIHTIFENKLG